MFVYKNTPMRDGVWPVCEEPMSLPVGHLTGLNITVSPAIKLRGDADQLLPATCEAVRERDTQITG